MLRFEDSSATLDGLHAGNFQKELAAHSSGLASGFADRMRDAFGDFTRKAAKLAAAAAITMAVAFPAYAPDAHAAPSQDVTATYSMTGSDAQQLKAAMRYRADMNELAGVTAKDEVTKTPDGRWTVAAEKRMEARKDIAMEGVTTVQEAMSVVHGVAAESLALELRLDQPDAQKAIRADIQKAGVKLAMR